MLYSAFLLGLIGSFHCIGMCGPIAFVLPVDRTNSYKKYYQIFLYHCGRLLTYSLIGLLVGLFGRGLFIAGFQQRLTILIGVLMILSVIIPTHWLGRYNLTKPIYKLIGQVKVKLGLMLKKKSNSALFLIGFFNGFLPCGLVYGALLGALAMATAPLGALYMFLFGLGTLPMMTAAVLLGNFVSLSVRQKIQKAIPTFVIIIGLLFILRGLGLGIPYISPSDAKLTIQKNAKTCVKP